MAIGTGTDEPVETQFMKDKQLEVGVATAFLQEDPTISFSFTDANGKVFPSHDLADNPGTIVSVTARSHFAKAHFDGTNRAVGRLTLNRERALRKDIEARVGRALRRLPEKHRSGENGYPPDDSWLAFGRAEKPSAVLNIPVDITELNDPRSRVALIKILREQADICAQNNLKIDLYINPFNDPEIRKAYSINRVRQRVSAFEAELFELAEESINNICLIPIEPKGTQFYEDYINRAEQFGAKSVRFSIDMAQVMLGPKIFNFEALSWMMGLVKQAQDKGMNVDLCIGHMNFPEWLPKGWADPKMSEYFQLYARETLDFIIKYIQNNCLDSNKLDILLLNEPTTYASAAHSIFAGAGAWPPATKHFVPGTLRILNRMFKANVDVAVGLKNIIEERGLGIRVAAPAILSGGKVVDGFGGVFTKINQAVADFYDWVVYSQIRYDMQRARELGRFPYGFVAAQYYCSHALGLGKHGLMLPATFNPAMEKYRQSETFPNGWLIDFERLVENLIRLNHMHIESAIDGNIHLDQLPEIIFTEIGVPSGANSPEQHLNIINNIIEFFNNGYLLMLAGESNTWTFTPNSEWKDFHSSRASFGLTTRTGVPKPDLDELLEIEIDLDDPRIVAAAEAKIAQLKRILVQGNNEIEIRGRKFNIQGLINNHEALIGRGNKLRVKGRKGEGACQVVLKEERLMGVEA